MRYHDGHPLYDACGCIYPCPDHQTLAQDGKRDRVYWTDRYDTDQEDRNDQDSE